jgi:hypothetical protein
MILSSKIKKQIILIISGIILISSFYLIWKIYIHQIDIPSPPKQKIAFEKEEFVYFQIPIGKIVENVILDKEAQEKIDDVKTRIKNVRDSSKELNNLSQELKKLTEECTCGKSSCQEIECEKGCCCQAQGCSSINTCSKTNGCFIESPSCDISKACPGSNCELEKIKEKTDEMEALINKIEEERKKMLVAQLSVTNDYLNLNKAKTMISSAIEAIDYETFFSLKDSTQNDNEDKVKIETFYGWPETPTIKEKDQTFFDPATIYFEKTKIENKNIISISTCLELFMIVANQSPDKITKIMDENAKEVLRGINFEGLIPSANKTNEIIQKTTKETVSSFSDDLSKQISNMLSVEITDIIVEELKGESGNKSSLPVKLIEPMSVILLKELPTELEAIFGVEIKTNVLDILSNTDLFSPRISKLFFEKLEEFIPNDLASILAQNIGETLPNKFIGLINKNIVNELFKLNFDETFSDRILERINSTLNTSFSREIDQSLKLSITSNLYPEIEGFLSENMPQALGFSSSNKEKLAIDIHKILEENLFDIFRKHLGAELTLKQAQDFSMFLSSSEIVQGELEENISKDFDLTIKEEIRKIREEISYNISEKISSAMSPKITDLVLEDISVKISKDLGDIISPAILKTAEQGIFLNSLREILPLYRKEEIEKNKQKADITYPQDCEFMSPGINSSVKEDKMTEACWEVKTIYDSISEQINVMNKIIELIQNPEKGCNPDICYPQCIDATCYAKDFYCGEFELKEFLGSCGEQQTSYPDGSLPCKSMYSDFYNQNGEFKACPSIFLANELIKEDYLKIENAGKRIEGVLKEKYDEKSLSFKEFIKKIVKRSELMKELGNELIQMTNECKCSKTSLCEKISPGCETKGCSLSSQCSETDIKNINEKIYDIEEKIQDLYYDTKQK